MLELTPRLETRLTVLMSATILAMSSEELTRTAAGVPGLLVQHRGLTTEPTATISGWEQLRRDALAAAPRALAHDITEVLAALDERGLLTSEARTTLDIDPEPVIQVLREVGPPGIAARDPAESLLVQLDSAPFTEHERAQARRLLTVHTGLLQDGALATIAEREHCETAGIERLLARMRRLLRPYPSLGEPESRPRPPDLIFQRTGTGIEVRVTERETLDLTADEPEAHAMIRRIHRRWDMLQSLGDLLAEHHQACLATGSLAFRPLTQAQAAQRLHVHESTISRAVAHRSARLVTGAVIPLSRMFGTAHGNRAAVAELCAAQPHLSDRAIAELLAAQGITVSRRTVNKYRRS